MATPKRDPSYLAALYRMGVGTGRPPTYNSPEALRDRINQYFAQITPQNTELVKDNEYEATEKGSNLTKSVTKEVVNVRYHDGEPVPTLTGLSLFLGFSSRSSLYEYEQKNPEFADTIRAARSVVERYHEIRVATSDKAQGSVFLLQSMGWTSKSEIEVKGDTGPKQVFHINGQIIEF